MKIGCCIPVSKISEAKALGYAFVELAATEIYAIDALEWPRTVAQIKSCGLPVQGFNAFCTDEFPIVGPYVDSVALHDYAHQIVSRANDLGCKSIGIGAPNARMIPIDFPIEVADTQMKQFLEDITEQASVYDITILYEAINVNECNYGNTDEGILEMVKCINKKNLAIVWDTFHALESGNTMTHIVPSLPFVRHVHICSTNDMHSRKPPQIKDAKLFQQLVSILTAHQYSGTLSVEAPFTNFAIETQELFAIFNKK